MAPPPNGLATPPVPRFPKILELAGFAVAGCDAPKGEEVLGVPDPKPAKGV